MKLRWATILVAAALPAAAANEWVRLTTPEFELYTTADISKGGETLRQFEQVREFFLKASPVRAPADFPMRIIEFNTAGEFEPYRPNTFATAYFLNTPMRDYIVIGNNTAGNYARAIHEYMHLVIRHSGLRIPLWLNEGWADVYSTLRPVGKETAVGDLLPERVQILSREQWMSFKELTSVNSASPDYHEANLAGVFYAESWALTHMLYFAPEYRDHFGKFVMALHNGKTAEEACNVAFGRSSEKVFSDLRLYLSRKRIFGRIYATGLENPETHIQSSPVAPFDSRLMLADLLAVTGKGPRAKAEYQQLEEQQPDRPDLLQSIGNLALANQDSETARKYFEKAFKAGAADARMCFELAVLETEAKQPPAAIIPILERALKSKPDYTEAKVQLGLTLLDAREFGAAVSMLVAIPKVTPERAPGLYCGLAYGYAHIGDADSARRNAQSCREAAKTDAQAARANELLKFVDARSLPSAGLRPGEVLQRVTGTLKSVECSPEGNRLQLQVENSLMIFDLPAPDAVEISRASNAAGFSLQCGPQQPVRIGVEYAPPRSALRISAGIIRRILF